MKNLVEEIIGSFSKQELREFKYFLGKKSAAEYQREDLKLVELIRSGSSVAEKNINAYHQTRKRLKYQLEQFMILENLRNDNYSRIYAQMEVAKYLFHKNLHKQGWEYLLKAEEMAAMSEDYRLLDYNYDIQISYSYNIATPLPAVLSVPELLEKRESNLGYASVDSNANAAYALLVHELRARFSQQLTTDIDELINTILHQYGLNDRVYDNNLRVYCKIANLVCRALREKREYSRLKSYAINIYETLERKHELDKIPADFLMDLLDAICVATLRSRDYINCSIFTNLYTAHAKDMQVRSDEYSYYDFIPLVGVFDLCLCTGQLEEARKTLLGAKKKYGAYKDSPRIYFLLRINLLAVHFSSNEYDICIKLYNEIQTLNDRKILNEPGFRLELILFTEIYGIIFHYEDGDAEYALYLLQKLKRKYATLLKRADSRREKQFIKILEQILSKPSYIKSKKFRAEGEECAGMKAFIAGDFEYISMSAWLHAKLSGRSYYECFLDLVK